VRGALEKLDGVGQIDIEAGEPEFQVEYDPRRVDRQQMLHALAKAGEPATTVD
jgi:hypothetical protein